MEQKIDNKLVRVGQYMINIERTIDVIEADVFYPEYKEIRLRLSCPLKKYEVSLMKNHWRPDDVNEEYNYREVATVNRKSGYIDPQHRWGINEATGKEVLRACLEMYSLAENEEQFQEEIGKRYYDVYTLEGA